MLNGKRIRDLVMKTAAVGFAAALTVTSVHWFWTDGSMTAEAARDTLPGVGSLRDEIMESGDSYRILELAPAREDAELGFYIGGQEPLECLWDQENGRWVSWRDKLAVLSTREEREAFMQTLAKECAEAQARLAGDGSAPFRFEPYQELTAEEAGEDADSITVPGRTARGYFALTPGSGDWSAVFRRLSDKNIPIDDINYGKGLPYYKARSGAALSVGELKALAANPDTAGKLLYSMRGESYFAYAGTAATVWDEVKDAYVSGGDAQVSGGDVSGGDSQPTSFYQVEFTLINNVPGNEAEPMSEVYVADLRNTVYVGKGGDYLLTETQEGVQAGSTVEVPGEVTRFRGGLFNEEVFRNGVLGLENAEEYGAFRVEVCTMTPDQAAAIADFGDYDMLYIGAGAFRNETPMAYAPSQDMDYQTVKRLFIEIMNRDLPCVVDSSAAYILGGTDAALSIRMRGGGVGGELPTWTDCLITLLMRGDKETLLNDSRTDFINFNQDNLKSTVYQPIVNDSQWDNGGDPGIGRDLCYVSRSVWSFYGEEACFIRNGLLQSAAYEDEKLQGGFVPVREELRLENMYRKADASYTGPMLDETVYNITVFRYVVNYAGRRVTARKETLRVLEIQPAYPSYELEYEGKRSQLTPQLVSQWTGVPEGGVHIETMAITQFIGINDDLNAEYDMIYIGSNWRGVMNSELVPNPTQTAYNDRSMNGLIYSHVGDLAVIHNNLSGLLDTDFAEPYTGGTPVLNPRLTCRYPGNDLTPEKYNCLLDYLDAFCPVVVDQGLLVKESGDWRVDKRRVDNSSYLWEFLKEGLEGASPRSNLFVSTELGGNPLFQFYVNKPKLHIDSEENPFHLEAEPYEHNGKVGQLRPKAGKYYLTYRFTISNEGEAVHDTDYTCRLFLDANADGKFSRLNEEVTGLTVTQGGREVNPSRLRTGVEYTVTRQVPDNYYGCITWRLEVQQTSNPMVRTARKGYARLVTDDAAVIRILQIYFNSNASMKLEEEIGKWNEEKGEYEKEDYENASYEFHDAAKTITDEYVLDIDTLFRQEYEEQLQSGALDLGEYDMLVIGFSDATDGDDRADWTEAGVIGAGGIKEFIESGKSVLFAHDTTSMTNLPKKDVQTQDGSERYNGFSIAWYNWENHQYEGIPQHYWGYNMNRYIRDMVGMDTYGITTANGKEDNPFQALKSGVGLKAVDPLFRLLTPDKDSAGRYPYNFKDLAYKPGSGRAATVPEVRGYTYTMLGARLDESDGMKDAYKYRPYIGTGGHALGHTTVVECVNEGQITSYPFDIPQVLNVADTHGQYYMLDMNSDADMDGQTDVVVWYTLTDSNPGIWGEGVTYGASVKDVRNNYYIYNKGNITYTGMGDSAARSYKYSGDEAKLFLNTMIAAYHAGKRTPEIVTMDRGGSPTDAIYTFYDEFISSDSEADIYFRVTDLNMTQGSKTLAVKYFVEDKDGEALMEGSNLPVRDVTDLVKTYDMEGNLVTDTGKLRTDTTYHVRVPASFLTHDPERGNDTFFYIGGQTTMIKTTQGGGRLETQSPWGYSSVDYVNCELFDLD